MPDLSSNIAVLRRWSHSRPGEPLPANFAAWAAQNGTDAMQLQRQDPELVSLLTGKAPASLLADALQGQLSPIPVSEEQREADARKAEMQALYDQSQTEEGLSLTQKVRLQAAFPELAEKVMKENPMPVISEEDSSRQGSARSAATARRAPRIHRAQWPTRTRL